MHACALGNIYNRRLFHLIAHVIIGEGGKGGDCGEAGGGGYGGCRAGFEEFRGKAH